MLSGSEIGSARNKPTFYQILERICGGFRG